MGSLSTHIATFVILTPFALLRLHHSISLYLQNPSQFISKPYFSTNPNAKTLNLYLYFLLITLPIASIYSLFTFISFHGLPSFRFLFLEEFIVILMFWVLVILIGYGERLGLGESLVLGFGGVCFGVEYWMIGDDVFGGVSEIVYLFLGRLTILCAICCLILAVRPGTFAAEFFLCCGMVFKGIWGLQAGLSLYTDEFGLRGCRAMRFGSGEEVKVDVKCDLEEDRLRGVALMNLMFVVHAVGVVITVLGMYVLLSCKRSLRCGEAGSHLLAGLESDDTIRRPVAELEMD